ncbi:hypothetical protein [Dyadobacter sandarakinus]|uniref:Outer membrane protein beta-barrel domain-containing protein n=1 Tax=Dyadobacter sandarakinus TaxID=2747268 RepID=A0ABX7I6W7_9BACT|nr:hypothetical protein [Dyadobacter sandarakinus]QRR01847.1 hypothetical protein HWI92_13475 [Dyadobacter sandarakinus]
MKKLLLMGLLATVAAGRVQAQLQQGTKYAAATISFNGSVNKTKGGPTLTEKGSSHYFDPSIQFGKFIAANRLVGLGIGSNLAFITQKSRYNNEDYKYVTNQAAFNLSPFIRQYKSISPKWAMFLHAAATFSYLRYTTKNNVEHEKQNGFGAGIQVAPGISYWITPRFALESDINLLSLGVDYRDINKTNTLQVKSAVSGSLTSYFSVRASWYLQSQN